MQYNLYDGNFSDSITPGRELSNTTNFQSNALNRHGDSSNALDLTSSTDKIRIPYQPLSSIGSGDFSIYIWANIQSDSND